MTAKNPIDAPKSDYSQIIEKISSDNSAVGIDAQYTHAIIIEYLSRLEQRLQRIEKQLGE